DMLKGKDRRVRAMDLGPADEPLDKNLNARSDKMWIEPIPETLVAPERDPADLAIEKESIRLAFVAALQQLPARQRAVLILREVLRWEASEVAELLDTSVASVNSALQRARATLAESKLTTTDAPPPLSDEDRAMLERYVAAFERYDIKALTSLIREDAIQSMPRTTCGSPAATTSWPGGSGQESAAAARACSRPSARTGCRRSLSTSRARTAASTRGPSRCSSYPAAGSPSSPSSSTPSGCSRSSECPCTSTRRTSASPAKSISSSRQGSASLSSSSQSHRCAATHRRAS